MTCIVLVKNPSGGGILPITDDDEGNVAQYDTPEGAKRDTADQPLVRAWGGYVVDLDNLEVTEI